MRGTAALSTFAILLAAASPAAAGMVYVDMKNIGFSPAKVSAKVGDTIEWKNSDFVVHTATARDKSFDVKMEPDKTGSTVVKKPGKIAYYCRFHPNMTGEIDVSAK